MWGSASNLKPRTNYFKLSIQPNKMGWESGCLSATPLSRLIMDVCGRQPMMDQELHFLLLSPADLRAWRTSKLVPIGLIRQRMRRDTSLVLLLRAKAIPKYNGRRFPSGAL